jgi:hypothetical protein
MRTKNKMKDFDAEFEEWWEVVEEYFVKELEKNLPNIELVIGASIQVGSISKKKN